MLRIRGRHPFRAEFCSLSGTEISREIAVYHRTEVRLTRNNSSMAVPRGHHRSMRPSIRGDCGRATRQGGLSVGERVEQGLYIVSLRRDLTFDLGLSRRNWRACSASFFMLNRIAPILLDAELKRLDASPPEIATIAARFDGGGLRMGSSIRYSTHRSSSYETNALGIGRERSVHNRTLRSSRRGHV